MYNIGVDLSSSGAVAITKDNNELLRAITEYDETQYIDKVESFLREKGSIEDGKASERIVNFIDSL